MQRNRNETKWKSKSTEAGSSKSDQWSDLVWINRLARKVDSEVDSSKVGGDFGVKESIFFLFSIDSKSEDQSKPDSIIRNQMGGQKKLESDGGGW